MAEDTESKFEKQFPGLKGECVEPFCGRGGLDFESVTYGGYVHMTDIEKHCLDKQWISGILKRMLMDKEELAVNSETESWNHAVLSIKGMLGLTD